MKEKNLIAYTSTWREFPTFKLLPATNDCPYLELIYCPVAKILHCILKHTQNTFRFFPKVDKHGDFIKMERPRKYRYPESAYAEERVVVETPAEFIIEDRDEIEAFIKRFAENEYNFVKFLDAPAAVEPQPEIQQASPDQMIEMLAGEKKAEGLTLVQE